MLTKRTTGVTLPIQLAQLLVLAALAACGSDGNGHEPSPPEDASMPPEDSSTPELEIVEVEVTPDSFEIDVEDSVELVAVAYLEDGTLVEDAELTWVSLAPATASVSSEGVVIGLLPGPVQIVARAANGASAQIDGVVREAALPPPTISEIEPASASAGSPGFELVVRGTGFTDESRILWGPDPLDTTMVDAGELRAPISADLLEDAGSVEVRVETAGGAISSARVFTIAAVLVNQVAVTPAEKTLDVGDEFHFEAVALGAGGVVVEDAPISWTSTNGDIVAAFDDGRVRAVSEGSVTIKAWSGNQHAEAQVTVRPPPVTSVQVAPSSPVMLVGSSLALEASVVAGGRKVNGRQLTWTVTDPTVATVSPEGVVTGVSKGRTQVKAESEGRTGFAYLEVRQLPPPGQPRTYDLQWAGPPQTTLIVGESEWYDDEGELQHGQLVLVGATMIIDLQHAAYEQSLDLRILGTDLRVGWLDGGEATMDDTGVLHFDSNIDPRGSFEGTPGELGELTVEQQVGTAGLRSFPYVIR